MLRSCEGFLFTKNYSMNEIYLRCQFNENDELIVSKGEHICFEIIEGEGSRTVCIDNKQAYTLIKCLEEFSKSTINE